ncbi:glycerophosphocholine phosphodiesterase GPCPD1-like isoform X2 [Periplaneta americana]|uniref:glycerophosphocholine phosphodiesterase GPCPD1-like isoform X2 n=1 Tax=Periplaneta americana TaxID=6978 RepID=UPI0037E9C0CC
MKGERKDWKFRVTVNTLLRETVFVVGSCRELGSWNSSGALQLTCENASSNDGETVWSAVISIPSDCDVQFRYFVGILFEPDEEKYPSRQVVVRRWETNLNPRLIRKEVCSNNHQDVEPDIFGLYDSGKMIDRGWLTSETVVQFKLVEDAIQLWKQKFQGREVYVKLTPMLLSRKKTFPEFTPSSDVFEESMDTQDVAEPLDRWPITEISVMNKDEWEFRLQDQFGHVYNPEDCIIFNVSMHFPEAVAYMMDYYIYSSRTAEGEPPYHVGFSYILPSMLTSSEGQAIVSITSNRHRAIGQLRFDYLVVQPIKDFECDMSVSYSRIWKKTWHGLDVGHRGLGTSFKLEVAECAEVRENTIASLKNAASAGADLVEFDVQLSKDLVPVLYHDFHVCIAMKRKKQLAEHDMLELPVKDLTLEQLQHLKVYHLAEGKEKNQRFFDEELEEHQPFPTLRQALDSLEPHVGFNVEIKWTMQLKDGTYELNHPFDLNMYLDTVLKVVLDAAGSRKIVFSCFHPDICTMIRLKQNKYPVMFLTQGVTQKYPAYRDPRTQSIPMAVHYANSAGILGINVHTEDILRDSTQVKLVMDAGLVIFCWGDDNNSPVTIKHLKQLGIHGVIYDKIDKYSSKEVKESIFLAEAREMQSELRKAVELGHNSIQTPLSPIAVTSAPAFELEDVENARKGLSTVSTTSILSSWPVSPITSSVPSLAGSSIGEGDAKISPPLEEAIDVGCGGGQSTEILSPFFKKVQGFDPSESQITEALRKNKIHNITYRVGCAEKIDCPDSSVQLVTASQACHWFDLPKFYSEVCRVLVPNGVLVMYGYLLPRPKYGNKHEKLRHIVEKYYSITLGNYVFPESKKVYLDNYRTEEFTKIPFINGPLVRDDSLFSNQKATVSDLVGYVSSWSAFQNYQKQEGEEKASVILQNFEQEIMNEIGVTTSPMETELEIQYNYFLLMGRKPSEVS